MPSSRVRNSVQRIWRLHLHVPPFVLTPTHLFEVHLSSCSNPESVFHKSEPIRSYFAEKLTSFPQTKNVSSSAFVSPSSSGFPHVFIWLLFRYYVWLMWSALRHSWLYWNYPFESAHLFTLELLSVPHCLTDELKSSALTETIILDFLGFLLGLKLFLLFDFLLQHILKPLIILGLA
jgi:hypothetical protein